MKKYLFLILLLIIASLNFHIFLHPYHLITGGTQGIAIIISSLTTLRPSIIILIINTIAIIISYFFLDYKYTKSALLSTFLYPLFVHLTSHIPLNTNLSLPLSSLISGLIYGITSGFIYHLKFSSGGITIFNLLLKKYLKINLSLSNFLINLLIIIASLFTNGLSNSLYSILTILTGSITIHLILKLSSHNIKRN